MRFRSKVHLGGKTATGILVPDEVVEALGNGKRPPVTVTLSGYSYRTTVARMGNAFWVPLNAEHREAAGVAAGDELDVDIENDIEPRVIEVPSDLAAALEAEPEARAFFDSISYSKQRGFVQSVTGAKTEQTRIRRIEKAITMLREGRGQ